MLPKIKKEKKERKKVKINNWKHQESYIVGRRANYGLVEFKKVVYQICIVHLTSLKQD